MSTDRSRSYNLGDLFELVAASAPDRLCVAGGGIRYTFGEFDQVNAISFQWAVRVVLKE